jgi:methyl-accepting chemotaxis protein
VFVVVASLFISHRVAGPLYRFEKSLEEMNGGNFNFEIRLRSKDEGKELARLLNDLNTMLSSQLKEMRDLAEGVSSHLAEVRGESAGAATGEDMDKAIALNKKLRDILNTFKLKHNG